MIINLVAMIVYTSSPSWLALSYLHTTPTDCSCQKTIFTSMTLVIIFIMVILLMIRCKTQETRHISREGWETKQKFTNGKIIFKNPKI